MPISCCKGCVPPRRSPTCHSSCPDYIRESKEHREQMDAEYEAGRIMGQTYDAKQKAYTKFLRRRKRRRVY